MFIVIRDILDSDLAIDEDGFAIDNNDELGCSSGRPKLVIVNTMPSRLAAAGEKKVVNAIKTRSKKSRRQVKKGYGGGSSTGKKS